MLINYLSFSPVMSEDKIDIWKDNKDSKLDTIEKKNEKIEDKLNIKSSQTIKATDKIQIEEGSGIIANEQKVYGIYEPATYNFNLNMWSKTKAEI